MRCKKKKNGSVTKYWSILRCLISVSYREYKNEVGAKQLLLMLMESIAYWYYTISYTVLYTLHPSGEIQSSSIWLRTSLHETQEHEFYIQERHLTKSSKSYKYQCIYLYYDCSVICTIKISILLYSILVYSILISILFITHYYENKCRSM